MKSDGSRKTPRRKRSRPILASPPRQLIEHQHPEPREHGLAADDPLADRDVQVGVGRQEDVHARAELHQADALAALEHLPSCTRHTIRRASTPTTCLNTTVRPP